MNMREKKRKVINFIKENRMLMLFVALTFCYIYWDVIAGEWKLSFSNLIYYMEPWNSMGVKIKGPLLSDVVDSLLPSVYSVFQNPNGIQFWNSHIGLGAPEDTSILLYPLYYLYLLPVDIATIIKSMLQFFLSFFSMYLLMREWLIEKREEEEKNAYWKISAGISGIIYMFCSSLICWSGWPHSDVAMLAPFTFYLLTKLIRELKLRYALWLSAVFYLMLVAGMPTFAAYFLYLLGFFMIFVTMLHYRKEKKKIVMVFLLFSLSVVLGVLMSFPYTAQLLLSLGGNGYADSRISQGRFVLEPSYLLFTLFPDWNVGTERHFNECAIYVGMIGLWLLLFSAVRLKEKKQSWFWIGAWGILIVLIFTHGLDFLFTKMPAINTSVKFRVIVLLNFVTAILAGFQMQDILENREYYKKRWFYQIVMLGVLLTAWFFAFRYYQKQGVEGALLRGFIVLGLILSIGALLAFYIQSGKKVLLILLCAVSIYDMGGFAKSYFPLIEKGADSIPKATDSTLFLQENMNNGDRFAAVGTWVFFPNMNIFYDLKDIRAHDFVNTNQDLFRLYTSIDPYFYTTPTRTSFWDVENKTLLKYLGVKYLATTTENHVINYMDELVASGVVGPMIRDIKSRQEFLAKDNYMTAITIQVATYGNVFEKGETLVLTLKDERGRQIKKQSYPLSEIPDNSPVRLEFSPISDSYGKRYELVAETTGSDLSEAISIWCAEDQYEGVLYYENTKTTKDLMMEVEFVPQEMDLVYAGKDGLFINQMKEYAPRFVLSEEAYIGEEQEFVLGWMIADYYPNAVFFSREYFDGTETKDKCYGKMESVPSSVDGFPDYQKIRFSTLKSDEGWEVVRDMDDCVEVKVTVKEPRFLLLNEYYDKNWQVYVDGVKGEVLKANYTMRAVYLSDAGEHMVTFRYEPVYLYRLFLIAAFGAICFLAIALFCGRLQKRIDKICKE